jgi:hypothetical protein
MKTLEEFRVRQDELISMINDLKLMMQPENLKIKPNAKTAYQCMCDLGDKMKSHLSEEDRSVYPSLLIHEDPKLKSLAWGFISGERPLRKQFETYYRKWLKECDFTFSEEFLSDTREIFEAVEERINREQSVLLPRLEESGVFAIAGAK